MADKPTRRGWLRGLLGGLFGAAFGARAAGGQPAPAPAPGTPAASPTTFSTYLGGSGVTTVTYDAACRLTASADPPGLCVTTVYDGLGRPVEGGPC